MYLGQSAPGHQGWSLSLVLLAFEDHDQVCAALSLSNFYSPRGSSWETLQQRFHHLEKSFPYDVAFAVVKVLDFTFQLKITLKDIRHVILVTRSLWSVGIAPTKKAAIGTRWFSVSETTETKINFGAELQFFP